eukprot:TRINITY_DN31526_c0_g1_i2.p1 TRINITY_DN31526_c0_g1~~TRINITY_DN31526_c0_g1_i2.p1  ORF type:complete len:441 (-),score=42.81 TRINITY_DN31526_c0_g1_i2:177-1499(-)
MTLICDCCAGALLLILLPTVVSYSGRFAPSELLSATKKAGHSCQHNDGLEAHGQSFVECMQRRVPGLEGREELIRNYSCSVDDAGTQPLRVERLLLTGVPRCHQTRLHSVTGRMKPPVDQYKRGPLPGGDDLWLEEEMTVHEARDKCNRSQECAGFTFSSPDKNASGAKVLVWFKRHADPPHPDKNWHAYYRRKLPTPEPCIPEGIELPDGYDMEVIRDKPMLIARVKAFLSDEECNSLMDAGGDIHTMQRSYTSRGEQDPYRRSWSSNIDVDLYDLNSSVTQMTVRLFAVARRLTGYPVHPPGQEPLNAVIYRDLGDEYRPHCDGTCDGAGHRPEERVLTAMLTCVAPDAGGQTSFTKGALKLVHRRKDVIFFAYKDPATRQMDPGSHTEHSGCPLRDGMKYIITQWFREGVSDDFTWESAIRGEDAEEDEANEDNEEL